MSCNPVIAQDHDVGLSVTSKNKLMTYCGNFALVIEEQLLILNVTRDCLSNLQQKHYLNAFDHYKPSKHEPVNYFLVLAITTSNVR